MMNIQQGRPTGEAIKLFTSLTCSFEFWCSTTFHFLHLYTQDCFSSARLRVWLCAGKNCYKTDGEECVYKTLTCISRLTCELVTFDQNLSHATLYILIRSGHVHNCMETSEQASKMESKNNKPDKSVLASGSWCHTGRKRNDFTLQ